MQASNRLRKLKLDNQEANCIQQTNHDSMTAAMMMLHSSAQLELRETQGHFVVGLPLEEADLSTVDFTPLSSAGFSDLSSVGFGAAADRLGGAEGALVDFPCKGLSFFSFVDLEQRQ